MNNIIKNLFTICEHAQGFKENVGLNSIKRNFRIDIRFLFATYFAKTTGHVVFQNKLENIEYTSQNLEYSYKAQSNIFFNIISYKNINI